MEVHARSEDNVAAVFLGLIADSLTHFAHKFGIPGRSETGTDGECCGVIGLVGAPTGGIDTYTGRAIGEYGGRDAQTWNGWRGTGCTSHEISLTAYDGIGTEKVVCTANE